MLKDPYEALVIAARNKLRHAKELHHHPYSVKMIVPSFGLVLECEVEAYTPVLSIYSELRRVAVSNSSSLLHLSPEQKRQLLGSSSSFYVVTSQSSQCLPSESTFGQLFRDETMIEIYLLTREELLYWPKKRIADSISPARKSNSNPPLVTSYSPAFLRQSKGSLSFTQPPNELTLIPNIPEQPESDTEALNSSSSFDIQMLPIQTAPTLRSESSHVYKPSTITKTTTTDIQLVSSSKTLTRKEAMSIQEIQRLTKALQEEKRSSQRLQEKVEVLERQRGEIETMLIDLRMTTDALKSMETKIPASAPVAPKSTTSKGSIFSRKKATPSTETSAPPAPAPTSAPPPPISLGSAPPPPPPPVLATAPSSGPKSLADMIKERSSMRDQTATFKDPLESKQAGEGSDEPKTTSFLEELQKRQALKRESGKEFLDPEFSKQNRPASAAAGGERSIIDEIRERNSQRASGGVKTPFIDPIEARKAEKAKALQEAIDLRAGLRRTGALPGSIPQQDAPQAALFASPVFRKRQALVEESVSKREQEIQANVTITQVITKQPAPEPAPVKSKDPIPEPIKQPAHEPEPEPVKEPETKHIDNVLHSTVQPDILLPIENSTILEEIKPTEKRLSLTPEPINIDSTSNEPDQIDTVKDTPIESRNASLDREKRKELSEIAKLNLAAALASIDKEEQRIEVIPDIPAIPIQPVVDNMPSLIAPHPEPGISYFDDIDDIDVTISIGESTIQRSETPQETENVDSDSIEPEKTPTPPPPPESPSTPRQSAVSNRGKGAEKIGGSRRPSNHRSRRKK